MLTVTNKIAIKLSDLVSIMFIFHFRKVGILFILSKLIEKLSFIVRT